MEVYDMLGRRVAIPVTTPQPPPTSLRSQEGEVSLDVRGLPEGMYYLRIGSAEAAGHASARFEILR